MKPLRERERERERERACVQVCAQNLSQYVCGYVCAQILAVKFLEMMSTLVSFHGDMIRMEEQISWIAFRHIKYGAKPQHAKVMGDVLVETMMRAVGEEWTGDMALAWQELWHKSCDMMIKVIGMRAYAPLLCVCTCVSATCVYVCIGYVCVRVYRLRVCTRV